MSDHNAFLQANPNGVMVTVENGKPRTRVFQYLWSEGDRKAYFCTSNQKDVYRQMKANPAVAFCTWNPATFETLNLYGEVRFVGDRALKVRALDENPGIKGIYQSPDNPEFEIFFIAVSEVKTFDFTHGAVTSEY